MYCDVWPENSAFTRCFFFNIMEIAKAECRTMFEKGVLCIHNSYAFRYTELSQPQFCIVDGNQYELAFHICVQVNQS